MHEYSLARSLIAHVEEIVSEQGGSRVHEIRMQCGPLSGIEPALLMSAFERLRPLGPLSGAKLTIDWVELSAKCNECGGHFEPEQFRMSCPNCGSTATQIISGDSLVLESLVLC